MSRVFQPALGMGKPTGRFEVEDLAKHIHTSSMALLLKALSHLGDVPEHLLDGGELVHLDWSPEEELEDESEETTASLVGEKVVSGKV